MSEHQHAHWSRLSATPHAVRREAERRCQGMPMAVKKSIGATIGDWLCGIGLVAFICGLLVLLPN